MANSFETSTIAPSMPVELFTDEDLGVLRRSRIRHEEHDGSYWFWASDGVYDNPQLSRSYSDVFRDAIRRSDGSVTEVVIQGAYTCSAIRTGEFGGFVERISESGVERGTTDDILRLMRSGRWPCE